jgi:hypothetical protein
MLLEHYGPPILYAKNTTPRTHQSYWFADGIRPRYAELQSSCSGARSEWQDVRV